MNLDHDTYDEPEWAASVEHEPLSSLKQGEAVLIYRHWIWANLQKIAFEHTLNDKETFDPLPMVMLSRGVAFMFVWYGLLWSVIEALDKRRIVLRGALGHDVGRVRTALKKCRNAVMHVPDGANLLDPRIQKLVELPEGVTRIRRVHHGLGRLLREEVQRQSGVPANDLATAAPDEQARQRNETAGRVADSAAAKSGPDY